MRIGIIGSSKLEYLEDINPNAKEILENLAKKVIKHEIVTTPDKGSVSEYFAKIYLKNNGLKVHNLLPLDETEFGLSWMNTEIGEKINCGTWRNQPEKFNEETDALLCVGYAVGVLAEIAYSKWFNPKIKSKSPKPIYIIRELVSCQLPREVEKSLNIKYISYKDFRL